MDFNSLLETLNLSELSDKGRIYKEGLYFYNDLSNQKTDFLSVRVKETLKDHIEPKAFFCINNEPLILFFEKPHNLEELQKQIWNFNQSPAIFINDGKQWLIKNGFKLLDNKSDLELLTDSNNISDFEYFKIITGKTWEKYKSNFEQKNRVDFYLLKNIEEVRNILIHPIKGKLYPKIANHLIGRVIFIRYLIDRKVELNGYGITKKEDFYEMLDDKKKTYRFFQQVKDDFNGNLFPLIYDIDNIEIAEENEVNNFHLLKIKELLQGGKIYEDGSYQPSFFDIYDFSIIPIEFVSNVYEKFIGIDKQAEKGAYYTPLFLVDYIQKETVSNFFKEKSTEYNCKVLDPACGSGIFLVETLRQIISRYKLLNPQYNENYFKYKKRLKSLLTDNIFGIDKDENAISVAIFSLYITLLDNLIPKSIVGFQFPILENTNFFSADFFNKSHVFNEKLKQHKFQFILGNPPWATKHPEKKQLFEKYIENRKKKEKSNLEIENREIAEAFLVRVSDFNFNETALIVTSKILYKVSRKKNKKGIFRNYFLNHFTIRQVVELSSVRHYIFNQSNDESIAPATILFYKKENNIDLLRKNIIKHISLKPNIFFITFRLIIIEKYDVKNITQKYFIDEDWIWKVLVYGNILDYYFIKRLKKNKSIHEYISDSNKFIFGKGVSKGGGDKNNIEEHKKIEHSIDSKQKGLKPFQINYSKNFLTELEYVHRPRRLTLYKAPILLVGKGISSDFKAKSAISLIDVVYTDAITGIKSLNQENNIIYTLESLFNSNLYSYFLILTNSSIGIEREQSHDKDDKFSIPLIIDESSTLEKFSNEIKDLYKKSNEQDFYNIDKQIENVKISINNHLINLYNVSIQEKSLIDYTNTVTIPLLKGNGREKVKVINKIKYKDDLLKNYAQIFINHFGKRFNSDNYYFEVEIIYSNHTILMKFKITSYPSKEKDFIIWKKQGDKDLLKNLAKLVFENLSDNLFLQKDIKGFEEDYFYVVKPNQYKSWHPALAYLDLSEFIEALHNSNIK